MQRPGGISPHNSSRPHDSVIALRGPRALRVTFEQLSVTLLFIALACAACFMPAQNDTWWHLRAGEDIWRTHGVPLRDTFSHTAFGTYWPDHEWLSQALFFALYQIGGMKLLTAVLAAVLTATWMLVWRLTEGRHRPGLLTGVFFAGYGVARIVGELFREPDAHLGYLWGPITMGMLLSVPLLFIGAWLITRAYARPPVS